MSKNIHTNALGGSEIRDQLAVINEVPVPASGFVQGGTLAFGAWRARANLAART